MKDENCKTVCTYMVGINHPSTSASTTFEVVVVTYYVVRSSCENESKIFLFTLDGRFCFFHFHFVYIALVVHVHRHTPPEKKEAKSLDSKESNNFGFLCLIHT